MVYIGSLIGCYQIEGDPAPRSVTQAWDGITIEVFIYFLINTFKTKYLKSELVILNILSY